MNVNFQLLIGAPVLKNQEQGHIVFIDDEKEMFVIAWLERGLQYLSIRYANELSVMIKFALENGLKTIDEIQAASIYTDEMMKSLELRNQLQKDHQEKMKQEQEWRQMMKTSVPRNYCSVIIAERVTRTMGMDDYINQEKHETIILCLSEKKRDSFPEMRKAAKLSEKTKFLFSAGIENREKYSGGRGYYLSETDRGDGWVIKKRPFFNGEPDIPVGELTQQFTDQIKKADEEPKKNFSIHALTTDSSLSVSIPTRKAFWVAETQSVN